MDDIILSFFIGFLVAFFLTFFVLLRVSPFWLEEDRAIVYTTDSGIICKENKKYPKLNCKLIEEALGPKLNIFEIKEK